MLRVVRASGYDGVVLAFPEVDPRSGELAQFVAVAAQGHHAGEISSRVVSTLLGLVADPDAWRQGASAIVRHALAAVEPMTVHGGVKVSAAVALRKGRMIEAAYSGDLQIRCAAARDARWHVPGVKHGEAVTATNYAIGPGDVLVTLSLGVLEEIPPPELLGVLLSSAGDESAELVEKRIAGSSVPQLYCAARFGRLVRPTAEVKASKVARPPRWKVIVPAVLAICAAAAVLTFATPWQRRPRPPAIPQASEARDSSLGASQQSPRDSAATPAESVALFDSTGSEADADLAAGDSAAVASVAPSTLVWKQRIGGSNFSSSPALAGMKVYVGSKDHHLYCLLTSSGEVLWKFKSGGGIGSSPAVDAGNVYFGSYDSTFYCVDRHAGRCIWKQRVGASIGASPLIHEATAYCGCKDGRVYAWDTRSGVLRWRLETGAEVWARPLIVGSRLFIGSIDRHFYCVDVKTGAKLWTVPVAGAVYTTAAPGPDSTVLFATNDGTLYQLGQRDGTQEWRAKYEPVYSSPAVADGHLFFGCKGGDVLCVSLTDHREVWRYATGADVRSSPVVVDGSVLVGSYDGRLYSFSVSGRKKWAFDTESRIYSTPALATERVYFGDMTGWLYCIGG
ncbi:MAG: PQQ-binding-like beta-propeller repeat protein [Candidatus Eisenbacteria bacterium]|jgi:outer membrane protein assembly factor BamB|nr:PQQ-binding-like beta-propeller repeat protein [Candidatus Eisenbacteria bacterium]